MSTFQNTKPARTADELISKLRARNLTIEEEDEIEIKNIIRGVGYFRLSGYFGPLQPSKDFFRNGAQFKDILRLYEFDKELRRITSGALKTIEIAIKTKLTDTMSLAYESIWYSQDSLFATDKTIKQHKLISRCEKNQIKEEFTEVEIKLYETLKNNISDHIERNKEFEYIKKFKIQYGNDAIVPSWMMMECVSFGIMSRLFSLMKNCEEKKIISRHFGATTPDMFTSWLHGLVVLRNSCAHHSRIWNKHIAKDLQFPKKPSSKFITENSNADLRRFYGISGCILQILNKISPEQCSKYQQDFITLINTYGINKEVMGFPIEYEVYDIWRSI